MPVIPEESIISDTMDDFVNWDSAPNTTLPFTDSSMTTGLEPIFPDQALNVDHLFVSPQLQPTNEREMALLFENPSADDFSFWALEHYEQTNMPAVPTVDPGVITAGLTTDAMIPLDLNAAGTIPQCQTSSDFAPPGLWGVPNEPCAHCKQGGYQCKTIQEGIYKGYCTSCVALRCQCSFGLASGITAPTGLAFPSNPWPTLGDHPNPIRHDEAVDNVGKPALNFAVPLATAQEDPSSHPSPAPLAGAPQPKLGARLSRESVKILKNWVSTHSRHPYPTEEEKESLQRLTGLNKTQISNWLANARRRGKIPTTRSTSPHVRNIYAGPSEAIDIPQPRRSGTPSPFDRRVRQQQLENIPLQRWANSPPENEPASVKDIARAITSSTSAVSSGLNSPLSLNFTDDGSGRSLFNGSSASSLGTSQSSGTGSFASAFSHASRGSFGSAFSSLGRGRRRRRRRSAPHHSAGGGSRDESEEGKVDKVVRGRTTKPSDVRGLGATSLVAPLKTYQCTFCTETFKTKHDWQRHEKSLHLSLERWVCAPQGATTLHPDTKQMCCVFCGEANPSAEHIESHNFAACQERALGDRTFYRKDHLRQHLKLVHGGKFVQWSMDQWKVATPEIRSRCGFCGIVMDTWTFRVDHLAEHFKTGRTMADWKGDWGFDQPVLEMVENSIPPYLIHDERNSPLPFSATWQSPSSPRNAYELLRGELSFWLMNQHEENSVVNDKDVQREGCRVIFAAEMTASQDHISPSWLRDLLMADNTCVQQASLLPIRTEAESRMARLHINGKDSVFDACPFEAALLDFVRDRSQLGLTPVDSELQAAACDLIRKMETQLSEDSGDLKLAQPSAEAMVAGFWLRLIKLSTGWLAAFRERAHLPRSDAMADESKRPVDDPTNIDATIHNYSRLEGELSEFVRKRHEAGEPLPDDAALQCQARLIIYELDDGWNQTAADDPSWLAGFKQRHMSGGSSGSASSGSGSPDGKGGGSGGPSTNYIVPSRFFLNDTNCYRRLAKELSRFAKMVMSPNNPNHHIPTDEELQHQARWILYDEYVPKIALVMLTVPSC